MIESIDLTKMLPPGLAAYPAAIAAVIPDIAEATRTEIIRLAGERLGVSTDDYVQGLQPIEYHFPSGAIPEGEHTVATIALVGWLPNALEHGWSGGDMKAALLNGRNAKQKIDGGTYNIVPFRHGAAGGGKRNFQKMGSAHASSGMMSHETGKKLGRAVYKAAKGLGAGQTLGAGHSPKLKPHHATDIHADMHKQAQGRGSKYMTFRAVSDTSDGWVHPGIDAHHLFQEASDYSGQVASKFFGMAMSGASKGGS